MNKQRAEEIFMCIKEQIDKIDIQINKGITMYKSTNKQTNE